MILWIWQNNINQQTENTEWTPNKISSKKCAPRYIIVKLQTKAKEDHLKQAEGKDPLPLEAKQLEQQQVSCQKPERPEISGTFFKCCKKRTMNLEFYVQWKYPSEMQRKWNHSHMKETYESFLTSRPTLKEWLYKSI